MKQRMSFGLEDLNFEGFQASLFREEVHRMALLSIWIFLAINN
jgi:hypothetical protein